MWKVRELADKVTNVVMNYTEIEAKVREATNDDPWGPTGTLRHELAQATFSYDQFPEVMGMLWKRIAENKRSPRRIYKSLLLVHHLLLNGSDRVIRATTDRLYEIRQLQDYHVVYEPGFNIASIMPVDEYKDGEMNVRVKAKEVVELIQDEERLREERKKSKKNRDKYVGIGSDRTTSRWNDFDDDLQFKNQTSSKYDDFEDQNELGYKSEPKSPKSNSNGGSRYASENSFSAPKPAISIKLKSDAVPEEHDFDPRAGEPSTSAKGGDFADFQSAFGAGGATTTNSTAKTATSSSTAANLDFFSTPEKPSTSSGGIDLLGLDMSAPAVPAQHVIGSNTSFDGFQQGFQSFQGFQNVHQLPAQAPQSLPFQQQLPMFQATPIPQNHVPQSHQDNLLFGNHDVSLSSSNVGMLQPQQVNHINNNNVQQGNVGSKKPTLEGTTWSDLNFSMDDLNLSSAKPKPSAQPSMNQLLSSPTKSKPF